MNPSVNLCATVVCAFFSDYEVRRFNDVFVLSTKTLFCWILSTRGGVLITQYWDPNWNMFPGPPRTARDAASAPMTLCAIASAGSTARKQQRNWARCACAALECSSLSHNGRKVTKARAKSAIWPLSAPKSTFLFNFYKKRPRVSIVPQSIRFCDLPRKNWPFRPLLTNFTNRNFRIGS